MQDEFVRDVFVRDVFVKDVFDYAGAIAGCAARDAEALRRLYDHASPYLLGVALRIVRDRQTAEDVLHDAFVKIWTAAGTYDGARGAARGWLFSIVRHEALNVVRGRLRLVTPDEDAAEAIDAEVSLAASAGRADAGETRVLMGRLNDCLDHLDEPRRNSLMFAYLDGCSHSEIAARLGAPLGSVKAWIRRGLQSLRECMQ
ncbi:sigma-70 family RNA polymerase sigma factor [Cupriavidus plantarum]|uniref:RNA polymerase sigma-70 factor (ECF subfamily) n=2 Tax=Cupriavidus plantarum TaxID=942865 RepID=A0A316FKK0_9BURK|nr:sigma-70 family RNA polymerase sigma factor [Cupriavidus plantarum]PWK38160.1 RNA polymerase sigma-70 factor (ECF subfamily) [Cupriavidus plantarum]REE91811.1 RNA polymerase sigma-70 factor (ECF subfamily) [Cupriavidus plantarum]RLK46050.1 RNA polymerase sigma-70 factor (ECF subfamily) [Cupriavidus plantarum]CAG2127646.1 ECF RNA polymerase sigma factor SigK [Cupriavidus plantarum]SMR67176.1 RNA polymerase sigma-70 factor, ECF subfamily [Cupriavidus plantarum]